MSLRAARIALCAATAALALAACAAPAQAAPTLNFCPAGEGAGQCAAGFEGIATDFEANRAYVADKANNRVDVFEVDEAEGEVKFLFAFGYGVADGSTEALQKCTSTCFKGISGPGAGQLSSPTWIAVDNSAGSSHHDVYVTDANHRVQKFDDEGNFVWQAGSAGGGPGQFESIRGLGVDGAGNVYVIDTKNEGNCEGSISKGPKVFKRVQKLSEAGAEEGEVVPTDVPCGPVTSFAVTASGEYWVASEGTGQGLRKYPVAGTEASCEEDLEIETKGIGLDEAGHLFAAQRDGGLLPSSLVTTVAEFGTGACPAHLRRFAYGQIAGNTPKGLAPLHTSLGDVMAAQTSGEVAYLSPPQPGPLAIYAKPPLSVANTKATVEAVINPEGRETAYRLQYVDAADYEADVEEGGEGFEGEGVRESEPQVLGTPKGEFFANATGPVTLGCAEASEEAIEEGECLAPETEYHWRVIATSEDNEAGTGPARLEGEPFETTPPFEAEAFATDVGITSARLAAIVDPLGIPTKGIFEYVTEAQFEAGGFAEATRVPDPGAGEAELDFGGGEEPVRATRTVSGLTPGTIYRYRLAAGNPLFGPSPTEAGTFRTYRTPAEETACPNQALRAGASAPLPDCRAYEMVSPLDKEGADIRPQSTSLGKPAALDQSSGQGDRMTYGAYRSFAGAPSAPFTSQYLASRGAGGWQSRPISPPRERNIKAAAILRGEYVHFAADLCEGALASFAEPVLAEGAIPGYFNLYRRQGLCGSPSPYSAITAAQPENQEGTEYELELQGVSADGRTEAFAATDNLEGTAAPPNPGTRTQLYAQEEGGAPAYACILPGGAGEAAGECSAGSGEGLVTFEETRYASTRHALSANGKRLYWSDSTFNKGTIYLRENPLAAGPECAGESSPCTVAVSAGGEAESGTSGESHFWGAAADGSAALYSSEGLGGELYLFTLEGEETTPIAGQSAGVMGASADLSRIYFASREAIAGSGQNSEGAEAAEGEPNLYLYEGGEYRFVATLAEADVAAFPGGPKGNSATSPQPARRNGQVAADGAAAIFASSAPLTGYDNTDAASPARCGQAEGVCDSEAYLYDAEANGGEGKLTCVSCNPSGARPRGLEGTAAKLPVYETTLYQPRALFLDGRRVLFESVDPLSPRDSNGHLDVYEWEAPGTGGCDSSDPAYSAQDGGCVSLLSSGQAKRDAELLDADQEGRNVFFSTLASLVPADYGLVDVYDAREGGGFPAPEAAQPACEGESCQPAEAAPQAKTPASSAFHGPGNLSEAPSPFARCNRSGHRARAYSKRAKSLRRNAKRLARRHRANPKAARRARAMRAKATRYAKAARKQSAHAKRCRARVRKSQRSAR